MEGGNLTHNIRAKKVNWYRRGKRVSCCCAHCTCAERTCMHACMQQRWVWHTNNACDVCCLPPLRAACCRCRLAQIALDVARALVYLHSKRIVHLDIKSPNILLSR